ncbi:MAG: hypothetical protein ACKO97_05150, partial [Actinomycetota bacterium]
IGADMNDEARLAYARLREFDVTENPATVWSWLANSYDFFPEARHDKVTYNYDFADSPWHSAFTTNLQVLSVEVDGEKVLQDGRPTRVDLDEVRSKANEQAVRLHKRLEN